MTFLRYILTAIPLTANLSTNMAGASLRSKVNWGKDEVATESMPGGTTELANPNAGVESPKVAVVRYAVQFNDSPLSLVIDRASEDFKILKQALGKA